jgi:hypothetical protein
MKTESVITSPSKEELMTLYKENPWVKNMALLSMFSLVAAFVLCPYLQGKVNLVNRYCLVAVTHLIGFIAGLSAVALTPACFKSFQKKKMALFIIINGLALIMFGYRAVVLLLK